MNFKVGDWIKCTSPENHLYGSIFQVILKHDLLVNNILYTIQPEDGDGLGKYFLTEEGAKQFTLTPKPLKSQADKVSTPPKITVKPSTSGVKHDSNKRQWWFMWQFLPELEQVVDILDYGNKKYPADDGSNWRKVDNAKNRYTSAAMRHWSAWLGGEKVDAETGKSHLAHMITNLLFLMWFERNLK